MYGVNVKIDTQGGLKMKRRGAKGGGIGKSERWW